MSTGIEWTDETWNPTVGCTPVSPGCLNCYAATMAGRLGAMGRPEYVRLTVKKGVAFSGEGADHPGDPRERAVFNGTVRCLPERLALPLRWRKPRRVFVDSMSDLFHEAVPFEFVDRVFAVMALCPRHTFQVLTKRPERMAEYTNSRWSVPRFMAAVGWLAEVVPGLTIPDGFAMITDGVVNSPNVWLGTSVEDQARADERIPHLLRCPAAVRFLSCEPLLGPVTLGCWSHEGLECRSCGWRGHEDDCKRSDETGADTSEDWYHHCPKCEEPTAHTPLDELLGATRGIGWVIVGGESGAHARPCNVEWVRSIVGQCKGAGVPVFVKQVGANPEWGPNEYWERVGPPRDPKGGDPAEWPDALRVREMPGAGGAGSGGVAGAAAPASADREVRA